MQLDTVDLRILAELQQDGSLTNVELARRVHLSPCLIRVAVRDIGELERFIVEQLTPIPGIEKIRSSFGLKQVRYKTALPLPGKN